MAHLRNALAALLLMTGLGHAAPPKEVRIGVLTDLSGPYADVSGTGSIEAARMAIEDMGPALDGWNVEMFSADAQDKPDIGSSIARKWLDQERVDMIVGAPNSAIALALQNLVSERHKIQLITAAASTELTGKACSAFSVQWHDDSYMQAASAVRWMAQRGSDTWYFITADYAFGHTLEAVASRIIQRSGGRVLGSITHPLGASEYSSYLLAAQASGAKVIALANGGLDQVNAIKQAGEFHIPSEGQTLLPFGIFITVINSLGLEAAKGAVFTVGFYWDLNDATRAWSQRYFQLVGRVPDVENVETYSAVRHYLRAVAALQSTDGAAVMAWMKANPLNDFYAPGGIVREDGRLVHDVYFMQVKTPAESKRQWDYYKLLATIPAAEAFRPLSESECPLVRH